MAGKNNNMLWLLLGGGVLYWYLTTQMNTQPGTNMPVLTGEPAPTDETPILTEPTDGQVQALNTELANYLSAQITNDPNATNGMANKHVWWYWVKQALMLPDDTPIAVGLDSFNDMELIDLNTVMNAINASL